MLGCLKQEIEALRRGKDGGGLRPAGQGRRAQTRGEEREAEAEKGGVRGSSLGANRRYSTNYLYS